MGGGWSQDSQQEGAQLAPEEITASSSQQSRQEKTQTVGEEGKLREQQSQQEKAQTVGEEGKLRKRQSQQEKAQTAGEEGKLRKQQSQQEKARTAGEEGKLPKQQSQQDKAWTAGEDGKLRKQQSQQEKARTVGEEGKLPKQQSQQENKQQVAEEGKSESKKLPHNYQAIIKEADTPLPDHEQLKSEVFLNQKRKKYWIDEKTGANCFMLFARELSIAWADTPQHWSWCSVKEMSNVDVEVAKLLNVCWLEVDGKFETSNLSPNTSYEVVFVVMIDDPAYGWNDPATLKLACPDGKVQERKETLKQKPRGEWMELHAGDFRTSMNKGGEIQFTLLNYDSEWKRGLVVQGAVIRPKTSGGRLPGLTAPSKAFSL